MEGTPFGRYLLLDLLGRGGMGEVWRAHDTVTDRTVAIKLLPQHLSHDEQFQRRFRREALAAARLANPHVIPIHTHGDIDGRLFLEMPMIEGRRLEDVIGEGPMPPSRAVHIIEQLADALEGAHAIGLIHRDVKPSNILLTGNDFAYLIDFGIATMIGDTRATNTGSMIGSYHYMAPERLAGDDASTHADIYSLACILFECLTGARPFPGESLESQVGGHLGATPPRPSVVRSSVPDAFDAVIATGMAKNPAERYPSVTELAQAARASVEPSTSSAPSPRHEPLERPVSATVAAAAVAPTQARPIPDSSSTMVATSGSSRSWIFIALAAVVIVGVVGATVAFVVAKRGGDAQSTTAPSQSVASTALANVTAGDCLTWTDLQPDAVDVVSYNAEHRFEVTEVIPVNTTPAGEFGPNDPPPSDERMQQISAARCPSAARQYLGAQYDPYSPFTPSLLWPKGRAWSSGERYMLCGLALTGHQQPYFTGRTVDNGQSSVFPSGTCLGLDQSDTVTVDCAEPHESEVTGSVRRRRALSRQIAFG